MRELLNLFKRQYSAVSLSNKEPSPNMANSQRPPLESDQKSLLQGDSSATTKSLRAKRSLSRGFSILDSFFYERKIGKRTRWPKCVFLLMAGGLFAIGAAVLMYIIQPYDLIFRWKLVFGEGGEIFDLWAKPPVSLYLKVYLYNITNPEEFLAGNEKMRIEEIGPYVYQEMLVHDNVTFNDNGTLSTTPRHPLIWKEDLSEGHREDDMFMLPHIALLSIAQVAANKNFFFRLPINLVIRQTNSQPIVQMTAKEFMFGYSSALTTLGNKLLPEWIYFEKVGLIDRMYDFESDFETFYTGEKDSSASGLYDTYRGSMNLPQWNDEHCSNINNASDGTKFQSFIEPNGTHKFFRKSMCRPQRLVRVGESETITSLEAYRYMFEENALDNGFYDERNKCYCKTPDSCMPRGLIDVHDCYYGFPIALSYPHFLDADPKLVDAIDGCVPNRTKHESYFMIQPESGLPLKLNVRFQINMAFQDLSIMSNVERFSNLVVPMLWFDINMIELPIPLQNRFNLYLNILPIGEKVLFWGSLAGGLLLLLIAVTRASMRLSKSVTPAHKISKHVETLKAARGYTIVTQKMGAVYRPCEQQLIERKCDIPMDHHVIEEGGEQNYMLESLSDNDESECGRSWSPEVTNQNDSDYESKEMTPIGSHKLVITEDADIWEMGPASASVEDIDNDDFHVLRIVESRDNVNTSESPNLNTQHMYTSHDSISLILDHV